MIDHGAREHSHWSASASARNFACSGALTLTQSIADRESEAAAWGTATHQLSEVCLRTGGDAAFDIGMEITTKAHSFIVDDEMADTAQQYVDYVRSRGGTLQIEQRFNLAALNPPFDAGGTGDAVIYHADKKHLEVVDLKGGRGVVVEAINNPQLRTYGLGAVLANPSLAVETVTVTIVQPRAPHKDGRIRSETFHVADLLEWTGEMLEAMRRSKFAMVAHDNMPLAAWAKEYLRPGDHCAKTFCAAAATCPALQQKALDEAGVWFDELDTPRLSNQPSDLDVDNLARILDAADMIEGFINACRQRAQDLAESGTEIPNHILVDKIGRRAWAADEAKIVQDLRNVVKLTDDQIFNQKIKSPAQIEKVLGVKRKAEIRNMFHTPVTGHNLVRADKTTRPAATPAIHQHFSKIKD